MKKSEYKSYDDLPLFLNAGLVAKVLGVSPSSGYELMRVVANYASFAPTQGPGLIRSVAPPFPTLRIGRRMVVPKVWEYKLRPAEFLILSYLCYRQAHNREEKKLCVQVMADSLHLTTATVEKHLVALVGKGLVTEGGVLTLKCEAGNFFSLPNEVFLLALPPSAFLAYAYLLYCEDRRTHQCHPSYRTIAVATGLSLNTAVKSVGVLTDKGLITVERSCWFNEVGLKRNGNNIYTILSTRVAVEDAHQQQLRRLELDARRRRALQRQENYTFRHPTTALCAAEAAETRPDPPPAA